LTLQRIKEKEEEIEKGKMALEQLAQKAERVESKVKAMKKFEAFLEKGKAEC